MLVRKFSSVKNMFKERTTQNSIPMNFRELLAEKLRDLLDVSTYLVTIALYTEPIVHRTRTSSIRDRR